MNIDYVTSPLGWVEIVASEEGIQRIEFVEQQRHQILANQHTHNAKQQLTEYFAGTRQQFDLPLRTQGTVFQQQVWAALVQIKYADTAAYADIANMLNNPKAVRAVGAANGKNPIAIVVPCHRVIGKDGTLTGYAGGLDKKAFLLELERSAMAQ
ncbi:methylated-DNA--[protein]-cysteine S-methyltransferase [Alteromonadaceae bacterium BrNp21-10]|nr:methylated-DNA--[protein]-cysteine S-methyltransferase [Alteromonadaceae bacterium BrNp21-10]